MKINRILTIFAAVVAFCGRNLASSRHSKAIRYPPGLGLFGGSGPYMPGGYVVDERRGPGAPDFDALDDDEAPNAQVRPRCRLPAQSFHPTIRAMADRWAHRFIPTAARRCPRAQLFLPTIHVMAAPPVRRR